MFDHFTFGITSQLEDGNPQLDISPCDISNSTPKSPSLDHNSSSQKPHRSTPLPSSPFKDLVSKLESQNIYSQDDISTSFLESRLPSTSTDSDGNIFLEIDPNPDPEPITLPRPANSASVRCRRLQRQLNTQLQCSNQHTKAVADMVENMVSTGTQCNLMSPPTIESDPQLHLNEDPSPQAADEGFYEAEEDNEYSEANIDSMLLRLRQAYNPMGPMGICKFSSVRLREGTVCRPRVRKRISMRKGSDVALPTQTSST